jgi:hypothetical protein
MFLISHQGDRELSNVFLACSIFSHFCKFVKSLGNVKLRIFNFIVQMWGFTTDWDTHNNSANNAKILLVANVVFYDVKFIILL